MQSKMDFTDKKIIGLIRRACAFQEKVTPGSKFGELSIDSLSFVELIVRIENAFGIRFEDEALNIGDYVAVEDLINKVKLYEKTKDKP